MQLRVSGLEGKVVLVSGGSSGIGRACCVSFGQQQAKVVVHYRSGEDRARQVVEEIKSVGGDAVAVAADLRFPAECRALAASIGSTFGRLDVLVNNVGDLGPRRSFEEVDEAVFDEAIAVNLKAPFFLTQAALPLLTAATNPVIVNVSTTLTFRGSTGANSHYVSAKAGVNALSLSLANELAPNRIRTVCICPGITDTELQRRHSTEAQVERALKRYLTNRMAAPEEIAALIVFVASDGGHYINKEVIVVDGGRA